jgi:hypothetical protein
MSAPQEPPDGDFVAYIEALQRESAARIHVNSQIPMVDTAAPGHGPASTRSTANRDASEPVLNRQQAEELLARLTHSGRRPQAAQAVIALVVGLVLLFFWFVADGGVVPLLIGLGFVAWSVSRLRSLGRQAAEPGRQARAQIAQLFGKKPGA